MTRIRFLTIVGLTAAAVAGMGVTALPYSPTPAQIRAERTCQTEGVTPSSPAWELCLSHVTRAYEWGEPSLAGQLAHVAGRARESCLDYGLKPQTLGYRACIDREINAQSDLLVLGDEQTDVNLAHQPVGHPIEHE